MNIGEGDILRNVYALRKFLLYSALKQIVIAAVLAQQQLKIRKDGNGLTGIIYGYRDAASFDKWFLYVLCLVFVIIIQDVLF